jgi:hypothetical protein
MAVRPRSTGADGAAPSSASSNDRTNRFRSEQLRRGRDPSTRLRGVDDRRELWTALVWRLLLACPFAVAAAVLFSHSAGSPDAAERRLLGLACAVAAGVIVGPGFAGLIAEPAGALFHPRRAPLPQPRRSIAESKRARGCYDEAIAAYEQVVAEFPADLESWTAMVELALVHLRDRARGQALARRALLALGDERSRLALVRVHARCSAWLRDASSVL